MQEALVSPMLDCCCCCLARVLPCRMRAQGRRRMCEQTGPQQGAARKAPTPYGWLGQRGFFFAVLRSARQVGSWLSRADIRQFWPQGQRPTVFHDPQGVCTSICCCDRQRVGCVNQGLVFVGGLCARGAHKGFCRLAYSTRRGKVAAGRAVCPRFTNFDSPAILWMCGCCFFVVD